MQLTTLEAKTLQIIRSICLRKPRASRYLIAQRLCVTEHSLSPTIDALVAHGLAKHIEYGRPGRWPVVAMGYNKTKIEQHLEMVAFGLDFVPLYVDWPEYTVIDNELSIDDL